MARVVIALVIVVLAPRELLGTPPGQVAASPASVSQQPPRDQPQPVTGTARIRGRVVSVDDGRPIRRVILRLGGPELREPRSTATDLDGRYEFADLPAGRYTVTANKAGFVTISHGQTRPNEMGRPIEIRDRQTVDRIDFALPRGAVITGRVVDEYGEPVAHANVQPMQLRYLNGQRQPMMVGNADSGTPDTGEFRLWGLAPGEYAIQASANNPGLPADSDDRSGYHATYFPGTTSAADAQTVRVGVGQTISGIDIMLLPARTARISGSAVDSRGQPLRTGFVNAMQRSESMGFTFSRGGQIRPDGTFTVSGVTPDTYLLRASVPSQGGQGPPETLVATVTVAGEDVSGVVLTAVQPATVTGRLIFDPPEHSLIPSTIRVMAMPKAPMGFMPIPMQGPPIVHDDFTFELKAAPGEMIVRAIVPAGNWMVKAVTFDGRDITDTGMEFVSGKNVSNVEIVMTSRRQELSGVVTNARGEIATDVSVFVFAVDRTRWLGPTRYIGSSRPDQKGRYTLRTVPPGDYYAVALEYIDPNRRGGDPTYFEELSENAVRFTLGEGETKVLDLKLTPVR